MKRECPVAAARAAAIMFAASLAAVVALPEVAGATDLSPPMLDIARLCDISSRHNMRAMSECVVAESEARAELLQNWGRYSNATAERCIKIGRKAKRMPYDVMAKCLSTDTASAAPGGIAGQPPASSVRAR